MWRMEQVDGSAFAELERGGRSLSILAVDDDDLFLDYLTWELETLNASVTAVTDPNRALSLLAEGAFDMFVTDWQMPGTDGIALVEQVPSAMAATPSSMSS